MNTQITKKTRKRFAKFTLLAYTLSLFGVFAIPGEIAMAAEPVCSVVTLTSGASTETAGFTETNPNLLPLAEASYGHALSAATITQQQTPEWFDPTFEPEFVGSGAQWVSTDATWPGGTGNAEGSSTLDQWRLYQTEFTLPVDATNTSAEVWYTADNATALYHNSGLLNTTGPESDVFGAVPAGLPQYYQEAFHTVLTPTTGTNTLNFVVRNWGGDYATNPTGLLYKAVVRYCVPAPVEESDDVTVTVAKYVDGAIASASSTQQNSFPMMESFSATNTGAVDLNYILGPGNTPVAYQSTTIPLESGASYSTYEVTDGSVVGASCDTGKPYALLGYTTGDTLADAALATVTTTMPSLTNITSSKSIIVWNSTCPTGTTTPPTTGSLTVTKTVIGGSASSSDFLIHVMKDGLEISGSPQVGTSSGTTYYPLASSTYVVSETGSSTTNYTTLFGGDCSANGTVTVTDDSAKLCIITNTVIGTPSTTTPGVIKVHIVKYLDGVVATASTSDDYLFPMVSTMRASNDEATSTSSFVLGDNLGGAVHMYGADSPSMQSPVYYTVAEVTDSTSEVLPVGATCATSSFRLKGYSSSDISFADAATQTIATTAPVFSALVAHKYLIVWNEKCTPDVVVPPGTTTEPRQEKKKIIAELKALLNPSKDKRAIEAEGVEPNEEDEMNAEDVRSDRRSNNNDRRVLKAAISNIKASLQKNLWVTDSRLNDRRGDKVFDREQNAVTNLKTLYNNERSHVDKAQVLDLLWRLVAADRQLAVQAIADAVAAGGTPANIVSANTALQLGDDAVLNDMSVTAIGHYQNAWGFAITSF